MATILIGGICTILGLAILFVIGALMARQFLTRARQRGVNVLDGIDPDELLILRELLQEVRKSELELRLKQKLKATIDKPKPTQSA